MPPGKLDLTRSGPAEDTRFTTLDATPKLTGVRWRCAVTVEARRSGIPQPAAAGPTPWSNADIEPTNAKACSQAWEVACWSPPLSVRESNETSLSLRPHTEPWVALKYSTNAFVPCCAAWNRPGTGPLMSEMLAMVISPAVTPLSVAPPVPWQPPATLPGGFGCLLACPGLLAPG